MYKERRAHFAMSDKIKRKDGDKSLFLRIKQGDRKAFTKVYHRYFNMLYGLSIRYLKDKDMAQDAVQQVFVKFWESHKEIDVKCSLSNYLYTITKNHILNQIRHRNTVVSHHYQLAQERKGIFEDMTAKIEKSEVMLAFQKALEQLPKRHKEICELKMEGTMSNEQIAKTLKVSVSTVKIHFSQAKELLRLQLGNVIIFLMFVMSFFDI